ncbi:MAG: HigA family addiction module antitoxin [Phormidesmis sp.]
MHNPPSPGEIIQETYLKPYQISGRELAAKLKVAPSTISRLLKAEIGLSAEMALRLNAVLGGSPEMWMNMQKTYALWQAEQSFDASELERIDFSALAQIEDEDIAYSESDQSDRFVAAKRV